MSMSTYPFHEDAALVITGDLAEAVCGGSVEEALETLNDADLPGVGFCSEFEGEAVPEDRNFPAMTYDDDFLVFIESSRNASLYEAAYRDFDELANEFKTLLRDAGFTVPDTLIEANICRIDGTYFC